MAENVTTVYCQKCTVSGWQLNTVKFAMNIFIIKY